MKRVKRKFVKVIKSGGRPRHVEIRPVSMLSFTMQVPWMSTASQGMIIPLAGIMMTSPGTSSVDMACSISRSDNKQENSENDITLSLQGIMRMLLEMNNVIPVYGIISSWLHKR